MHTKQKRRTNRNVSVRKARPSKRKKGWSASPASALAGRRHARKRSEPVVHQSRPAHVKPVRATHAHEGTPVQKPHKKIHVGEEHDNPASERTRGLSPMRIYLNQIEHIPLLEATDELDLSRQIQLKKPGWKNARKKMIHSNLRLVINIAKRYMNIGLPFSDIVEEGNIGLMRAVDKFNYRRGYRFSTYASWWIKQSIMRALSNQGKLIRIPVHMYETMSRWRKVREHLLQKLDRVPTTQEIAKAMKLDPERVKEIEQVSVTYPSSLNAPVSIEGDAELIDVIEDETHQQPHEQAQQTFKNERIEKILNTVNERERQILIWRFGLYESEVHTLEEVAQKFNITRERVRQIEEATLQKIRYQMMTEKDKLENYL